MQHFCLYGKNNDNKLNEAIDEREKDKPEIAGSGWLESVKSIADSKYGFSPMASAVIYHAPKGDLMNSTASFRDVFSADINTSQVKRASLKTGNDQVCLGLARNYRIENVWKTIWSFRYRFSCRLYQWCSSYICHVTDLYFDLFKLTI